MGATTYVPTEQEIRAVQALYRELVAASPTRSGKARQIARQLGAPYAVINQIVAPLRGPRNGRTRQRRRRRARAAARARSVSEQGDTQP